MTKQVVCPKLSVLVEENEQLKDKLEYYEKMQKESLELIREQRKTVERLTDENEQLKKDRFVCLDCEHSGYTEIGCLCEYNDHWQDCITECEDFKELRE